MRRTSTPAGAEPLIGARTILALALLAAAWLWMRAEPEIDVAGVFDRAADAVDRAAQSVEPGARDAGRGRSPSEPEPVADPPAAAEPGWRVDLPAAVDDWWRLGRPSPSSSDPIAALVERDGAIVVATKTDVVRYQPGGEHAGRTLATSRDAAAAADLSYVAFAAVGGEAGALWIGSWKGALFELRAGTLDAVAAESAEVGRIHAIHDDGDGPWIAARGGLLRLDREARRLFRVEGVPAAETQSVERATTGELHAAIGSSLWARDASGAWRRRWTHPAGAYLTKLVPQAGGSFLVGSRHGFALVREGREPVIELAERWITDFAITPAGDLWVATWDRGLLRAPEDGGGAWSELSALAIPDPSLSFAVADRTGAIWLGFYADGVRTFAADRAAAAAAGSGEHPG